MIKGLSGTYRAVRASLVIPTLNEVDSVGKVLTAFRTAADAANRGALSGDPVDWEILVVDGASTDGTAERARSLGAVVINEPRKGYGRAYKTGFERAQGSYIATADGDATYPVDRIPEVLSLLLAHGYDFVTCNRLARLDRRAMTTEHRIGNRVLNYAMAIGYHRFLAGVEGGRIEDSQSGMWVFRREILPRLKLTQDGMAFSEELKLEVILRGLKFKEIPIDYSERATPPKLSSWRDGLRNLGFLVSKRREVAREPASSKRSVVSKSKPSESR